MTSTPRSLLLAEQTGRSWSTKNKNRFQCAALAAYRAELDEAELRAARAVYLSMIEEINNLHRAHDSFHSVIGKGDDALRAVIEKARREDE